MSLSHNQAAASRTAEEEGGGAAMGGPPLLNLVTTAAAARGGGGGGGRQKIFVCPHEGCHKAYAVRNYLVEHERLHTGNFSCPH